MYHDFIFEEIEKQKLAAASLKTETETLSKESDEDSEEEWLHSKIRFDVEAQVVAEVPSRSMLSPADLRATWYQAEDFSRIASLNRSTVKIMQQYGNLDNEPDHCFRGLECKLNGEADRISNIKVHSIYAVLSEQSKQQKSKLQDQRRIAKVYKEHVFSSAVEAQERGISDEEAAREEEVKRPFNPRRSMSAFDDFDLSERRKLSVMEDGINRFERKISDLKVQAPVEPTEGKQNMKKSASATLKKLGNWIKPSAFSPKRDMFTRDAESIKFSAVRRIKSFGRPRSTS